MDWLFDLRSLRHRALLTRGITPPSVTCIKTSLMGNYGNVLPGAMLIKNNLILTVASEWTLLPTSLLSFPP